MRGCSIQARRRPPASDRVIASGSCPADVARDPVIEIVDPGLLLSIQDGGRPGMAREGITRGGAADRHSLAVANALVGNAPDAAGLEATLIGPTVVALSPVTIGLAGTMAGIVTQTGERVAPGWTVSLRAGDTLSLEPATGARGYLAVPGGTDVPLVLGSRSTAIGAGFGGLDGRALRAGDRLAAADDRRIAHAQWPGVPASDAVSPERPLRVLPGPHAADVGADRFRSFLATAWTISPTSDRVGLRLDGDPIGGAAPAELASHGVVAGTIQLPPDRRPIVLCVDHQPTGGYPVIAVVITADLDRLGQLAPGAAARFEATTLDGARAALEAGGEAFARALAQLRDAARWDDLWQGAGA
jgi:biotin-dependent carboxylase-like uncharacterized protein